MDYHTDRDRRTFRALVGTFTGFDLQKTAAAYEADQEGHPLDGLPASAFADPIGRAYPVQTKEGALLSAAYFFAQDERDPLIHGRLKKAAAFWGVDEEVRQLEQQLTVRQTAKCALELSDGQTVGRYFPWTDGPTLKQAAADFVANRCHLTYDQRVQAASTLLQAAQVEKVAFDHEVSHYFDQCLGLGVLEDGRMEELLLERQSMLKGAQAVQELAQGVKLVLELPMAKQAEAAVQLFNAFDEDTGLNRRYGRGLEQPECLLVERSLTKSAADTGTVRLQSGHDVRLADIDWQKVAEIDPALAEAVGGDLEKAAAVLPTWPRLDAEVLVQMLGLAK
jgi:hypothetical protein